MSTPSDSVELSLYNQRKHDPNDPDDLPIWAPISRPSLMMCLYVIPPLMTAISVAEIALRAAAPRRGREANFVRWTDEERDGFMADWPQSLYPHEDELPIASAALSIAVSLLVLGLAVDVAKNGPIKTTYWARLTLVSTLVLNVILAMASAIYSFALNSRSAHLRLERMLALARIARDTLAPNSRPVFTYDLGIFSREMWGCEAKEFSEFDASLGGAMSRACGLGTGARWLSLITFLLATGLSTVVLMDHRGGGYFMQSWKRRREVMRSDGRPA